MTQIGDVDPRIVDSMPTKFHGNPMKTVGGDALTRI